MGQKYYFLQFLGGRHFWIYQNFEFLSMKIFQAYHADFCPRK